MISTKRLIAMAKKWQRLAKTSRKSITLPTSRSYSSRSCSPSMVEKGHFVVYTADERRFALPLAFLESEIFRELLRWAEEEFGLTSEGPIKLPCDSNLMEYAVSIIQANSARELDEALILSLSNLRCSSYSATYLQLEPLPVSCC